MKNKLLKILNIVSTGIVILIVLVALFLVGSRLFGFSLYTVVSGSMSPAYNVGDLLFVKHAEFSDIKVDDPITYVVDEKLAVVTHRVIAVDNEKMLFRTKGDANLIPDSSPVKYENVIGVPQFSIPGFGYVSDFIQHPPGLYITIGIIIAAVAAAFLPDVIRRIKSSADNDNETESEPDVISDDTDKDE